MKLLKMKELVSRKNVKLSIIFFLTFLTIYITLATTILPGKKYNLQVGEIAKSDIEAPREVMDEESTTERKREASDSVPLQYTKTADTKGKILSDVNSFFSQVAQVKNSSTDDKSKIAKVEDSAPVEFSDDNAKELLSFSDDEIKYLHNFLLKTLSDIYDNNTIEEENEFNSKESKDSYKKAYDAISMAFNSFDTSYKDSQAMKSIGTVLANAEIKPNYYYDKDKTEELRKDAEKKVSNVVIKKDQIIVKKGEPVTQDQISILKALGLLNNNNLKFDWQIFLSLALFIITILVIQMYYLAKFKKEVYFVVRKVALICIINCVSLLLARLIGMASPYLIPLACGPMLLALLIDYKVSLTMSVINAILLSAVTGFKVDVVLVILINSIAAPILLRKMQQRNDILYSALYVAVVNGIFTLSLGMLLSNNFLDVAIKSLYAACGSILAAVLTIGFLPIFESVFDIVTTVKLLELSNPNNPLLKKLLMEAPGTYHHSVLVANLAELAAEQVGGNPLLARVCAYYHDIGKIKRPYFFKENQFNNDNPHDKITPNLSTLIIISHVKDGSEMAKEYKLPRIIRDVIEQHHGTSLVKYFYLTVKNSSSNPEEVSEDNFRYPGPIPQTKEVGIIMLADSVEAAVRSISDPSQGKIEEMVNNIIKDRLNEGQLDDCDITLKDLNIIKKSFLKSLNGIYHRRVEYPVDKWENKGDKL